MPAFGVTFDEFTAFTLIQFNVHQSSLNGYSVFVESPGNEIRLEFRHSPNGLMEDTLFVSAGGTLVIVVAIDDGFIHHLFTYGTILHSVLHNSLLSTVITIVSDIAVNYNVISNFHLLSATLANQHTGPLRSLAGFSDKRFVEVLVRREFLVRLNHGRVCKGNRWLDVFYTSVSDRHR